MIYCGKYYNKMWISSQETFPLSHGVDEVVEETDKMLKYHENLSEGVQQVCMLQDNFMLLLI